MQFLQRKNVLLFLLSDIKGKRGQRLDIILVKIFWQYYPYQSIYLMQAFKSS